MRELKASRKQNEELQSVINEIQYSKSEQAQELDNIRKENLRLLDRRNREYQELHQKYANLESTLEIIKVTGMETVKNEKEWKRQSKIENVCDHERDWEIFLKQNERIMASSYAAVQVKNHELHAKDQELQCKVSELNTYKTALIDMEICASRTLNSLRHHNQELLSLVAVQDAKIQQAEILRNRMKEMTLELENLQIEKANTERSLVHKSQEIEDLHIEFRSSLQLIKERNYAELEARLSMQKKNLELSTLNKGKQDACLLAEEKDRILKKLRDTDNERGKELGKLRKELETALDVTRQELGKSQCPVCKYAQEKVQANEYPGKELSQKHRAMNHAQMQTVDGHKDPEAQGNDSWTTDERIDMLCTTLTNQLSLASEKQEKQAGCSARRPMADIQLICPPLPEPSAHPAHQNEEKGTAVTIVLPVKAHALRNSELQNDDADLIHQEERLIDSHLEKSRKMLDGNKIVKHMQVQSNTVMNRGKRLFTEDQSRAQIDKYEPEPLTIRGEPQLAASRKAFQVELPVEEPAREFGASNVVNTETDKDKTKVSNTEKAAELMVELVENPALTIQSKALQEEHFDSQMRGFRITQQKYRDGQVTIQGHDRELELIKIDANERSRELQAFGLKEAADRALTHATADLRKQIQTLETEYQTQEKILQLANEQLLSANKNLRNMAADYNNMQMLAAEENTQLIKEQTRTTHLTIQLKDCREQCSSQKSALDTAEQQLESLQKTLNARCQELESLKDNMATQKDILAEKNARLLDEQEQSADLAIRLKTLQKQTDLEHCRLEETLQELENLRMKNQDLLRELALLKDQNIAVKIIAKGTSQPINMQNQTNQERKYTMARVEVEALRSELKNLRINQEQRGYKTQEHRQQHRIDLKKAVRDNKSLEVRKITDELVAVPASNAALENQVLQSKTQPRGKSLQFKVPQKTHDTPASNLETPIWRGLKKSLSNADVGTEVGTRHSYALGFRKKDADNGEYRFFKNQRASIYVRSDFGTHRKHLLIAVVLNKGIQ
ncbi:hypothetical protein EV368DRAFT_84056 [Lentinula lateritia]|nr:hypothetical protein EV368DRAFT_84056 [Lentinula lateritia]